MRLLSEIHKNLSTSKLVVIFLLVIAVFAVILFMGEDKDTPTINDQGEYVINFTEDGYFPRNITIKVGDTVRFMNNTDEAFWPASNVHPNHDVYPEFDPKQPVSGGESWAFTFDKVGRWVYHDHLYSWFVGRIDVTSESGELVSSNCNMESLAQGIEPEEGNEQCWENLIYEGMIEDGVKGAFDVFSKLYEIDEDFILSDCHARAHDVGDLAYAIWRQDGDLEAMDIPPESVYCNYGYFHGLIGHMIEENNDPKYLAEVCTYLEENYSDIVPQANFTCYHAAGHGLTLPPTDLSLWGNPEAMIEDALDFCEQIPTDRLSIGECYRGVYNVLTLWIWQDEFGLTPDHDDPLAICEGQEDFEKQEACYYEFGMYLTHSDDRSEGVDIIETAKRHISRIENDRVAQTLIHVLVAGEVTKYLPGNELNELVNVCEQLSSRLQDSCFRAIPGGIVAHGAPGQEYLTGIEFCELSAMQGRRNSCYISLFHSLRWTYDENKISEICELLNGEDQHLCHANIEELE